MMVLMNKKEKGKWKAIRQEPLEVIICKEKIKIKYICLLSKEGHVLMIMRLMETRYFH